jgi:lysozyme
LLKLLNQGQHDQVPTQLRRWVMAGGRKVKGLVNRREKEIRLWNNQI